MENGAEHKAIEEISRSSISCIESVAGHAEGGLRKFKRGSVGSLATVHAFNNLSSFLHSHFATDCRADDR
jgi:hypothetical protein